MVKNIDDAYFKKQLEKLEKNYIHSLSEKVDPNHRFSPAFEEKMGSLFHRKKEKQKRRLLPRWIYSAVALFCVVLCLCFFVRAFDVKAIKGAIVDFFLPVADDQTKISPYEASESLDSFDEDLSFYVPTYIPMGYKEVYRTQEDDFLDLQYRNESRDELYYFIEVMSLGAYSLDTKSTQRKVIYVRGNRAIFFKEEEISILLWREGNILHKIAGVVSDEELLKMAESIPQKEEIDVEKIKKDKN